MGTLKSMAFSKTEQKERNSPEIKACDSYSGEKYPYGLRIDLNNETLKKLGITSLPEPGATMKLVARVEVISASLNQRSGGKAERRLEVQITKMSLEPDADGAVAAVDKALDSMK